jgi:telomere length regulation protein
LKKLLESIHQQSDSNIIKVLEEFIEYLPGPMTPQKFTGLDCYPNYSQVIKIYSQVLESILEHTNFINYIDLISKIFAPDGGTLEMLDISLHILWNYIALNSLSYKTDCAIELISKILISDLIKSSIITETLNSNHSRFTIIIDFLLSLPNRLANKVGKNLPKLFIPVEFSNRIMNNILYVIDQLSQFYTLEKKKPNTKPISIILGKTIASFLQNDFHTTWNILECWCLDNNYAVVIRSIFSEVDRRAIDRLGYLFCRKLSTTVSIHNIIENAIIDVPNWNYTLCKKMIFLFYHEDDNIVVNLMNYLYLVQQKSNTNILSSLILELVEIWGDKSALIHTPFEQHYYLSKLIVVGSICLANITLDEDYKRNLEIKLFEGVPVHLGSSEEKVRTIGMVLAEIVIGCMKSNEKDTPSLKFEYDGLQEESQLIIKTLNELKHFKCSNDLMFNNAFKMLNNFFQESNVNKIENSNVISTFHSIKVNNINNSLDNSLDSDDDEFEPYDLSNDVEIDLKSRPKYIRDLIDGLNEQKDFKVWCGSLEVSESLIKSQLSNDDPSFAIELLTLLMSIEQRFYIENFEILRFQSAVAVVTVYPYDCSKYLCNLFYESIGRYAVSHRILILKVLTNSAQELSGFKKTEEKQKEQIVENSHTKYWEDIIKKRIQHKTRIISNPRTPIKYQSNRFVSVADAFFFPLIRGNLINPIVNPKMDHSEQLNILGVHLLNSLSIILCCAVNSMHATRMAVELLEWTWSLRFHYDVKIRMAVMGCVAAVLLSVPKSRIVDLGNLLEEFIMWLENIVTSEGIMNKVDNEVNQEARKFAMQVLLLYKNVVSEQIML